MTQLAREEDENVIWKDGSHLLLPWAGGYMSLPNETKNYCTTVDVTYCTDSNSVRYIQHNNENSLV